MLNLDASDVRLSSRFLGGPFHVSEAECSRVVCSAVDVSELLLMVESEETGRD